MPLTEADKRTAVGMVLQDVRLRFCPGLRRDPVRVGRIAAVVFKACEELKITKNGYEELYICMARLRIEGDYQDTVSFIPVWLLAMILKIIISILIDFWILHEGNVDG